MIGYEEGLRAINGNEILKDIVEAHKEAKRVSGA
jgi:hypothetical protein